MATRIISPSFSFVRLSDQHLDDANWQTKQLPGAELGFIIPVAAWDDVAFQFVVETETSAEADTLCGLGMEELRIMRVPGAGLGPTLTYAEFNAIDGPEAHSVGGDEIGAGRYRLDATHVLYYIPRLPDTWVDPDVEVACGGCFQIAVQLYSAVDTAQAVSNIFKYVCDNTDFTSVLDYYSEQDDGGFYYCVSAAKNRIRLPLYMTRPTFPEEEDSYRMSSGVTKIRKSVVRKSYEIVTDVMPAWVIECLRAVWVHDFVFIEDAPTLPQPMMYQGRVAKDGAFDPQWLDYKNYPLADVKFRVNALDYNLRKNNCGSCDDYSAMLVTANTSAGTPVASTTYTIDLTAFVSTTCCDPTTYLVDHFQGNYIAAISIDTTGTLSYTMKATLIPAGTDNTPFIRVAVTCGSVTKYIIITSTLT